MWCLLLFCDIIHIHCETSALVSLFLSPPSFSLSLTHHNLAIFSTTRNNKKFVFNPKSGHFKRSFMSVCTELNIISAFHWFRFTSAQKARARNFSELKLHHVLRVASQFRTELMLSYGNGAKILAAYSSNFFFAWICNRKWYSTNQIERSVFFDAIRLFWLLFVFCYTKTSFEQRDSEFQLIVALRNYSFGSLCQNWIGYR